MSDYTRITNFTAKDSLPEGDPDKTIFGQEIQAELDAIAAAIATKGESPGNEDPVPIEIQLACSDLTTELTTTPSVGYFRAPCAFTITEVRASLLTASDTGAVQVDINKNGSTILSTKLTIDEDETTSTTATTPAVISDDDVADDDLFVIDIDSPGANALGLIVTIIGERV